MMWMFFVSVLFILKWEDKIVIFFYKFVFKILFGEIWIDFLFMRIE